MTNKKLLFSGVGGYLLSVGMTIYSFNNPSPLSPLETKLTALRNEINSLESNLNQPITRKDLALGLDLKLQNQYSDELNRLEELQAEEFSLRAELPPAEAPPLLGYALGLTFVSGIIMAIGIIKK